MNKTDTEIHQIDLLLTLDYLLKNTDEKHPATQINICEHATNYGLKFNKNESKGNDVKRQRIGKCLRFLKEECDKFPDDFPFIIETTDSDKYYIEKKNGLSDDQVSKILAAIKNDKYTRDEDTDYLIKAVLDAFSTSKYNRNNIFKQYTHLKRGVRKLNPTIENKIKYINKAIDKKQILVIYKKNIKLLNEKEKEEFSKENGWTTNYDWYNEKVYVRPYKIVEHNNKPYAVLLPLNGRLIIEDLENIIIPMNLPEKEFLFDDIIPNRDLNELFMDNNHVQYFDKNITLDKYIERRLNKKLVIKNDIVFYFSANNYEKVKYSFEDYFNIEMNVEFTNEIHLLEDGYDERTHEKNLKIEYKKINSNKKARYCVVKMNLDRFTFMDWINENYRIATIVRIVSPTKIISRLHNHYQRLANFYNHYEVDVFESEKTIQTIQKM